MNGTRDASYRRRDADVGFAVREVDAGLDTDFLRFVAVVVVGATVGGAVLGRNLYLGEGCFASVATLAAGVTEGGGGGGMRRGLDCGAGVGVGERDESGIGEDPASSATIYTSGSCESSTICESGGGVPSSSSSSSCRCDVGHSNEPLGVTKGVAIITSSFPL